MWVTNKSQVNSSLGGACNNWNSSPVLNTTYVYIVGNLKHSRQ